MHNRAFLLNFTLTTNVQSMHQRIKIAIIGDFNFTYNAHHATNLAIEHTQRLLEQEINHYWIRIQEAALFSKKKFEDFDGIWIAPGPFSNLFFLQGILNLILQTKTPLFITGEAYKTFVEVLVRQDTNISNEKIISDNLVQGDLFEAVEIKPLSAETKKAYLNHSNIELSSCVYSIYPKIKEELRDVVEIVAENSLDEATILQLKNHPFCMASMFIPQISSTREMPHPLVSLFVTACAKSSIK